MSHADLAQSKQQELTGSHVNYYLEVLSDGTVVEAEDLIEHAHMQFASGTVMKSVMRLCKLRKNLGKPGSTKKYEIGKTVYYTDREQVITSRRLSQVQGWKKLWRLFEEWRYRSLFKDPLRVLINIKDPKRLDPYCFYLEDFIASLDPTRTEAKLLVSTVVLSLLRKQYAFASKQEAFYAQMADQSAERLDYIESRAQPSR
jgi:hypothetical protein